MRAVAEVRTLGKQLKLELHDALMTAGHNQGSVTVSLCATAHPLHTRFTNIRCLYF